MLERLFSDATAWGEHGVRTFTPCCDAEARIDLYGEMERVCPECGAEYLIVPMEIGSNQPPNLVLWIRRTEK